MKRVLLTLLVVLMAGITAPSLYAQKKEKAPKNGTAEKPLIVEVSSVKDLLPYLRREYVHLKMTPGTYRITGADVKSGMFSRSTQVQEGQTTFALVLVEGHNNILDFTGVTFEIESAVPNSFDGSKYEFAELHTTGNNNTVKGLKLINIGSVHDNPRYGWCNVVMDGSDNTLEDIEIRSKGSKPYGYGEVFGKGKGYVLKHWKHSAFMIRGHNSKVKGCEIIHRCYGHYLFIQGASGDVLIEDCYIEGEMITTDQILAEKKGTDANKVDFKSVWGYKVPSGYTLSTGEDAIRTYTNGNTIINGEQIRRRTDANIIARNCTVKHTRGGVSLSLGNGTRYVENIRIIGCQDGITVGNRGKIVNCYADAVFGFAYSVVTERHSNIEAEITFMPYDGEPYSGSGSKQAAFIIGSGHKLTFHKGEGFVADPEMAIYIGGDRRNIGSLAEDENYPASNITLINETGLRIIIDDNATNINVTTNGEVVDNGTNSTITRL